MRYVRRGLLIALAPTMLSSCALLLSFSGFDGRSEDAGAREASPTRDGALDSLGCYQDNGGNRDLPFEAYSSDHNTIEDCVIACTDRDYLYAGLQDGIQCYCGNRYDSLGPSGACRSPCPGNTAETCGGPYANSVYRTMAPLDAGAD